MEQSELLVDDVFTSIALFPGVQANQSWPVRHPHDEDSVYALEEDRALHARSSKKRSISIFVLTSRYCFDSLHW